jgi:hypothetical protein
LAAGAHVPFRAHVAALKTRRIDGGGLCTGAGPHHPLLRTSFYVGIMRPVAFSPNQREYGTRALDRCVLLFRSRYMGQSMSFVLT